MSACGGSTSDDSSVSVSTGGAWPKNTSNLLGGAWTMNTSNQVGGAWTVSTLGATGGSWVANTTVRTGGTSATGGKPGTETTHIAGAAGLSTFVYSTAGSSPLPLGGAFSTAGGTRALGGVTAIGGTYSSAGGAVQAGGASATGGSSALDDAVCLMPPQSGDCSPAIETYYFNASAGQCFQFPYSCEGNANRFETLEACQQRCVIGSLCPHVRPPTDQLLQCVLSSVCYYDVVTSCGCKFNVGHCDLIDLSCPYPDAGTDVDASADPTANDAGSNVTSGNQAVVCACGASGWTCRQVTLYSGGLD